MLVLETNKYDGDMEKGVYRWVNSIELAGFITWMLLAALEFRLS